MNKENTQGYRFVKLVKRTSPVIAPAPVFFENAPGELRKADSSDARKFGFESATLTLEALSKGQDARI
jgi:hypothetical protein